MPRSLFTTAFAIALLAAGCGGNAVLIARTPRGGVFDLEGERASAMSDARRQMSERCGGAYTIVGEREAIAGVFRGRVLTAHEVEFICNATPSTPAAP